MNKLFRFLMLSSCVFLSLFVAQTNGQTAKGKSSNAKTSQPDAAAARKLREYYFNRDYQGGYEAGQNLRARYRDNLELEAWYLANMARVPGKPLEALELAQKLVAEKGETRWTLIALVQTLANTLKRDELLSAAEKLIKLAPNDEEAIFTYNSALYANRKYAESVAWLDKNSPAIKDRSRLLAARANSSYQIAAGAKDAAKTKDALAEFSRAVELDPKSVNANYIYGYYLSLQKRSDEALPFSIRAISLSPASLQVRELFWKLLLDQTGKTEEQKKAELAADFESWVKSSRNAPNVLAAVAEAYDLRLKDKEKRDFYENQITAKYPNTKYDEAVLYNRISRVYDKYLKNFDSAKMLEVMLKSEMERTPAEAKEFAAYNLKKQEYETEQKNLRWAFIKRAKHFDEARLGNVYFDLFRQMRESADVTDQELTQLITGSLKYKKGNSVVINSEIAAILDRGERLRPTSKLNADAEKYARAGILEAENKSQLLGPNEPFASPELLRGQTLNTLGAILTKKGSLDEAEQVLLKAEQIKGGDGQENFSLDGMNQQTAYNLADLYLAKKDFDRAETYYVKYLTDRDSTKNAFGKLYEKRYGKKEGFEDYYAGIKQRIRLRERERVVASRIKDAKDAVPFSLKTIDNKIVSLADFKGKILVINVWGVWCVPCVAEMPQLQQLYKKYENDQEVAIITMDTNDELEKVKKFIADKKYDFPVLIGDAYVSNVMKGGAFVFPTTVFIDKQGKVAFVKRGNTGNLFEDFGWRIDALKQDK